LQKKRKGQKEKREEKEETELRGALDAGENADPEFQMDAPNPLVGRLPDLRLDSLEGGF